MGARIGAVPLGVCDAIVCELWLVSWILTRFEL
jgi:hypothetical protein